MRHGEFRCQKEAAWVVTNILAGGNAQQLMELCQLDVIGPLCALLKSQEPRFVSIILDALATLLFSARKNGYLERVTNAVEECGGLDALEAMQNHDNQEIYQKAYHIIEAFFSEVTRNVNSPFILYLVYLVEKQ
jgi:importin subunit alpha-2